MTGPVVIDPNGVGDAGAGMGAQGDQFGAGNAPSAPSGPLPTQQAAAAAIAAEQADRQRLAAGVSTTGDQTQQAAGAYGTTESVSAKGLDSGSFKDMVQTVTGLGKDVTSGLGAFVGPLASASAGAASALASSAATIGGQMAQTDAKVHPEHLNTAAAPDPAAKSDAAAPAAASGSSDQPDDKQHDKQR